MTTLFIGCGRMGAALARGMTRRQVVYFIDPNVGAITDAHKIESIDDLSGIDAPSLIILATKPDGIDGACDIVAPILSTDTIVVSLAAGIRLDHLSARLGPVPRIIRMMPNLPVLANSGVLACIMDNAPEEATRQHIARAFGALGSIFWMRDESEMDAVTALSGSGPAYLLFMAEQMQKEAERLGLEPETAKAMAHATLCGIGMLLAHGDEPLDKVRATITSPGGTTAAAIAVFDRDDVLRRLVGDAMTAAALRSQSLNAG